MNLSIQPNGTVKLSLPFGDKYIGKILGDTYIKKIKSELHKFRNLNSIGFNYELIEQGKFKFVRVLSDDGSIYQTTRLYILTQGKVQTFFKQSYEKQIFLPISEFGLVKALAYEKTLNSQLSLFERAS
jgi:hypothetical protein